MATPAARIRRVAAAVLHAVPSPTPRAADAGPPAVLYSSWSEPESAPRGGRWERQVTPAAQGHPGMHRDLTQSQSADSWGDGGRKPYTEPGKVG